jgi:monoterpene epsilon-lactone hydrolase
MSSIQGKMIDFWFRHQGALGSTDMDPKAVRTRADRAGPFAWPHKGVKVLRVNANGVPSEWLIPARASKECALLYIHGGAWFMGSTSTHRALVSRIAYASSVRALAINYRLAPEFPFPEGLEDCICTYKWLLQNGIPASQIVVAGDSAGGNLTLALLLALRDRDVPLPAGAVALSPATDLAFTGESLQTRLQVDPIFFRGGPISIIQDYISNHDPHEALISPLFGDLHGLPALLIQVGDHEVLLDDALRFGEKAAAAGVDVTTVVWPEMFHVFQIFSPFLPEARRAIEQIADFIRWRLASSTDQDNDR